MFSRISFLKNFSRIKRWFREELQQQSNAAFQVAVN